MRTIATVVCALLACMMPGSVSAEQIIFLDNFNDGLLDGWHTFGVDDQGFDFWIQDSQLWGKASSGADCCHCPNCRGVAMVDDLVVGDFTLEIEITNRNACGWLGVLMRTSQPTWSSWEEVEYWQIGIDPGARYFCAGARDAWITHPGFVEDWDFDFGTHIAHYFRIVMAGPVMEVWHRTDSRGEFQLLYTITTEEGTAEGHLGVIVGQAAKRGSFDDVVVYAEETTVQPYSWSCIKALYR